MNPYLINKNATLSQSLQQLNELGKPAILIVVDENNKLIGSLTDGDIRRALVKGKSLATSVQDIVQENPVFIQQSNPDIGRIKDLRLKNYTILPIVTKEMNVVDILDLTLFKTKLPISSVIMAGGKGKRLLPLTKETPKALLPIGEKPILEYIIDYHCLFGITDFSLIVNHLHEKISSYFGDGVNKGVQINYVKEKKPLGTIGGVTGLKQPLHDTILLSNCDVLTNFDLEQMFLQHLNHDSDLTIATIPYTVQVPYGVVEIEANGNKRITEKPTYTYAGNAGIYLFKRSLLNLIPKDIYFDAHNFVHKVQEHSKKIELYEIKKYWRDIGKPEDLAKAKADLNTIYF